jgi:hypothetical protein
MQDSALDIRSPLLKEKPAAAYITRSVSSLRRGRKDGTGPKFVRIGDAEKSLSTPRTLMMPRRNMTNLRRNCDQDLYQMI